MKERGPYRIPSIGALIAFESAARNGSFTRAAGELRTSQSALSRRIAALEEQLSTRLFDRSRSGVSLTAAGHRFRDAVVAGLGVIETGAADASSRSDRKHVVIACSHDASQLVVFPRYDALQDEFGDEVQIRISTHRRYSQHQPVDLDADLLLTWKAEHAVLNAAPEDVASIFREEVQMICSSEYAAIHADIMDGPVAGWGELTFLDMKRPNQGWTSWPDWFEATGGPERPPRYELLESYIQVLEATAAGQGIALGWRHYIGRYLESGAVIVCGEGFVEFGNSFVAVLTAKGQKNPSARKCLPFFGQSR